MPSFSRSIHSATLAVSSFRTFSQPRSRVRSALLCLVLAAMASGAWSVAGAQASTATTTTLSVTSGNTAVTKVAAYTMVTLSAAVTAGNSPVSPGLVQFCDASASNCTDVHMLGSAQLSSNGTAVWRFRPAVGTHTYKAVFVGTGTKAASTSTTATLTVITSGGQYPSASLLSRTGVWGSYSLTATVEEFGGTAPLTGNISFEDTSEGSAVLATAPLGVSVPGLSWATQAPCMNRLSPTSTVAADFNGDGYLDIAAVEGNFQLVAIFVYQPSQGCYQQTASYSTGPSPSGIVVSDFNSDGNLDLAIPNEGTNTLTLLLGNGDGTFTQSTVSVGSVPYSMVTADFNGDGIPDLAVGTWYNGITILLGKGDGTFTAGTNLAVGSQNQPTPVSIIAGDFNGDGKIDLVIPTGTGVSVYLGNGDGTFSSSPTSSTVSVPANTDMSYLAPGDFNRDGKLDLAISFGINVVPETGEILILLGNGDGTFTATTPSTTPDGSIQLAVADFNVDGIPDIAALDIAANITVLIGQGDGTFASPAYSVPTAESTFIRGLTVGDMDGDGRPDILYPGDYPPNSIAMYFGLTKPMQTASTEPVSIDPSGTGQHLVVASYPGDANATSATSEPVSLWGTPPATATALAVTANGTATSSVPAGTAVTLTATVTSGGNNLTTGQVNFCDATAPLCTDIHLLGSAQLTSSGTAVLKLTPAPGSHSYKAVLVESGYGAPSQSADVALTVVPRATTPIQTTTTIAQSGSVGNYTLTATVSETGSATAPTGAVSFLDTSYSNQSLATAQLGSAVAGLALPISYSYPVSSVGYMLQALGDFNGDGRQDIAAINSNAKSICILLSNGDGTFTAAPSIPTSIYPYVIAVGDFNHDGKLDIAVATPQSAVTSPGQLFIYLGNGDGTFTAAPGPTTFPTASNAIFVADVNGDSKSDVTIGGYYNTQILLGNGDGTFASPFTVGSSGAIAVGDFNGDGIPDMILGYNKSAPTVYLGKGDGTFSANGFNFTGFTSGAGPAVVADFNGDGIPDLAIAALYYSSVNIFLGKGDGTFTAASSSTNPSINEPSSIAVADLNSDGKPDLIITNVNSYSGNTMNPDLTFMLGNGDGTFMSITGDTQLSGTWSVFAADFNGDGTPDLSVGSGNGISVLLAEPTQTLTATATGVAPTGPAPHMVAASYPGDSNYASSISGTTSLNVQATTPVISAAAGTYTSLSSISITDATPGASIYYQGNGTLYTNGYVLYTGPIPVLGSGTASLSVYATETGYQQSSTATANYTFSFTQLAATPAFSLPSGVYYGSQQVAISSTTSGAVIFYTTDGSMPTSFSTVYTGPITVSTPQIVKAVAAAPGFSMSAVSSAQYLFSGTATPLIYTVAGNGMAGDTGDGGPAAQAQIGTSYGTTFDSNGNLYFSDSSNHVIRRIDASTGNISTVAGTGIGGFSGDGGPATAAQFYYPEGLAFDAAGNLYIADTDNNRIREINAKTGIISTILGNGSFTLSGTGSNQLLSPQSVAVDGSGNLYIGEAYGVLKIAAANGTISEIVSTSSFSGIAVDNAGDLFFISGGTSIYRLPAGASTNYSLPSSYCIVRCGTSLPGNGTDSIGDGGPAANAFVSQPRSIAVDSAGNLYIADTGYNVIRRVDAKTSIITAVTSAFARWESGDGGLPDAAGVVQPTSISLDASGNLAIADQSPRIRKIIHYNTPPANAAATPTISLAAGSYGSPQTVTISDSTPGASIYYTLDGSTPTTASGGYFGPINIGGTATVQAIAVTAGYLPSAATSAAYTITSTPAATISTVAGSASGNYAYCSSITQGTSVQALQAATGLPQNVVLDSSGNLYLSDTYCNAIWKVAAQTRTIALYAGTGLPNNYGHTTLGDGGPATSAILYEPLGIALDSKGNLFIADYGDNLVRRVDAATGIITSVAGNGAANYSTAIDNGDGGQATSATVTRPTAVAIDTSGNLYVSDYLYQVREVAAATGIITTIAGNGTYGYSGDGGAATSAQIEYARSLTLDYAGNLYFIDNGSRIRKVMTGTGTITTVAGNGTPGFVGDGGPALKAQIAATGLAADPQGNLYLSNGNLIRFVSAADGTISTIAGSGIPGYWGDGGAATVAGLHAAAGLAFDSLGNLYIADTGNDVVRQVVFASNPIQTVLPSFTPAAGTYVGSQSVTIADTTSSAKIYYTTDGTTPTTGSAQYVAPIPVSFSETIKAMATASGALNSTVAVASYTILIPQTINFTVPASAVTYGLASITLSATATSGLDVVFSVQSGPATVNGSKLTITGTGTVVVAANQAGSSTYGAAPQVTQTIVVNQATPAITWATPAAIPYGTALGSAQLNATASVPGTFVYNPAAGAVPAVGTDTLSVTFTPADVVDFTTATATVKLTVTAGVPMLSTLSPAYASAGGSNFTLTVTGSGFTSSSIINWGSTALATTYGSATQLTAQVTAAEIAAPGIAAITVQTPAPSGGASNPMTFEVDSALSGSSSGPTFTTVAATVSAGATASYPVTLPSTATSISATCLNLPVGATCSYSSSTGAVTIATSSNTPAGAYQITVVFTETVPVTAGYLLPLLLLPLVLLRKKLMSHGGWATLCLSAALLASTVVTLGCGGSSSSSSSPQTQQVKHSGTVTLTVR